MIDIQRHGARAARWGGVKRMDGARLWVYRLVSLYRGILGIVQRTDYCGRLTETSAGAALTTDASEETA